MVKIGLGAGLAYALLRFSPKLPSFGLSWSKAGRRDLSAALSRKINSAPSPRSQIRKAQIAPAYNIQDFSQTRFKSTNTKGCGVKAVDNEAGASTKSHSQPQDGPGTDHAVSAKVENAGHTTKDTETKTHPTVIGRSKARRSSAGLHAEGPYVADEATLKTPLRKRPKDASDTKQAKKRRQLPQDPRAEMDSPLTAGNNYLVHAYCTADLFDMERLVPLLSRRYEVKAVHPEINTREVVVVKMPISAETETLV
ncbi:hypothetical protein SARC_03217 [Sphaeroforma arctica JP610]|uniref:Uncharacterized protein n=1 Tax=Sphaeroforma arctica JP610 TaxID=667725 RepID=A0A0L0G6N0_9EUKA|nr:hypothetical protein SARC_03217 [Sphaeroforma arctica JP610]KNC84574.1 hypothetical protein SARC_03217 [Sphaeroforma arctica JP610]|eukprot:XP_014158476.1 hypothetical protein SARC_03217 [Sphaeroforma arctica JP610]